MSLDDLRRLARQLAEPIDAVSREEVRRHTRATRRLIAEMDGLSRKIATLETTLARLAADGREPWVAAPAVPPPPARPLPSPELDDADPPMITPSLPRAAALVPGGVQPALALVQSTAATLCGPVLDNEPVARLQ
jgi:hypothetical protein